MASSSFACWWMALAILSASTAAADDSASPTNPAPKERVVSLSPATTELVIRLGAGDILVGRTRFCEVQESVSAAVVVGGIMDPSLEAVAALRPDAVILTEMTPLGVEERIRQVTAGATVLRLHYNSWSSLLEGIAEVGQLLGRDAAATELLAAFHHAESKVRDEPLPPRRALVLYGHLNPTAAGGGTFPDEWLKRLGFENLAAAPGLSPWPQLSSEYILKANPDLLIVADSNVTEVTVADNAVLSRYRSNPVWRNLAAVQSGSILLVPSQRLSIPDSRLADTLLQIHATVREKIPPLTSSLSGFARPPPGC